MVHQYLEVPAAAPGTWATVETKVAFGSMPSDRPLDVTASFGDGLKTTGQHTLDCLDGYDGDAIYVNIGNEKPVDLRLTNFHPTKPYRVASTGDEKRSEFRDSNEAGTVG